MIFSSQEYNTLLCILQIVSIYNAIILGWKVKKIGKNTFEFSKKLEKETNFNFDQFIDDIVTCKISV
jgi:hypothetical protein